MKKLIKKILQPNKLSKQLVVWFLLISLVPLATVTSLVYFISSTTGKKDNLDKLVVIADSKVHRIESYIRAKQDNVAALSQFPDIVEAIDAYQNAIENYGINSEEYAGVNRQFKPLFKNYLDTLGYQNVFLLSRGQDLLFSLKKTDFSEYSKEEVNFKHPGIARVFDLSRTLMQVELSNYEYDRETNQPTIFIASPVFKNKLIIGVIIFQIDNRELYRVINDYTGLGETGETIIGLARDNEIVFIAPTRHDPDAAFQRGIATSETQPSPLQEATRGITGKGIYTDYRGEKSLATWRYLPSFNAGIVVKIDRDEAMASVITNRNIIIFLGIITVILTILAATAVARSISNPVVELTKVAKNIAAGEWDRKIKIARKDEIGELALSFNSMAFQLKESFDKLEQRVRERTVELRKAVEEAREAEQSKDRFLANISHELRTPLNSILGYTKLVQRESKLDPNQEHKLGIVEQSGNHLLRLINDILDLSETEAGKMQLELSEFNLQSFLDGVVAIVRMWAIDKGVIFSYQHYSLPENIKADRKRLRQILINLLNNAIKFSDRGDKVTLKVKNINLEGQHKIHFEVIDNGVGLSSEKLAKIFDPFEQVRDVEALSTGTGLGLSISKQLIRLMGGDLQAESEPDRGSRFWFEIPLQAETPLRSLKKVEQIAHRSALPQYDNRAEIQKLEAIASSLEQHQQLLKVPPSPNHSEPKKVFPPQIYGYKGYKRKILIVDDKQENRDLLIAILEPLGFLLETANDGQQMLDIAFEIRPDLILLDLFMPVKTGFTSAKELREIPELKDIPVIVLSASFAAEEWSEYLSCDAFLNKPIDQDQLLDRLQKSLNLEWTYS
ncbi:MAG: ATP-binding protein [Prochloraceae cyanobacterium]